MLVPTNLSMPTLATLPTMPLRRLPSVSSASKGAVGALGIGVVTVEYFGGGCGRGGVFAAGRGSGGGRGRGGVSAAGRDSQSNNGGVAGGGTHGDGEGGGRGRGGASAASRGSGGGRGRGGLSGRGVITVGGVTAAGRVAVANSVARGRAILEVDHGAGAILPQAPANLPPPPNGDRRRRRNPQERRQLRNQQITIAGQAAGDEEVQHIDEIVAGGMRNRTRQVDNVDVLDTISDSIISVTDRLTSVLERARMPSTSTASLADKIDRLYKRRKNAADANMDQAVAHCEQQIYRLQTLEDNRLNTQYC